MATNNKAADKATSETAQAKQGASSATNSLGVPSLDGMRKMLEKVKLPGVDVAAIVEAQRKDFEALAEANKKAFEGMQSLAQRRSEMLQEAVQRWQDTAKDAKGAGAGDALSKTGEQARQEMQKAVENFRELASMEAQNRREAWKVLQERFEENMASMRNLLQPKSK